jgi:hypothetical protein
MIAAVVRGSAEPGTGFGPDGSGAPEFQVRFSRPTESSRSDSPSNSFRWSGTGTLHILERGLLVIAKRRFPMGFRSSDERFFAAFEICDVYREGNSVRVEVRSHSPGRDFFQFWADDAATAGTIVRLLPTTRTIEYEGVLGGGPVSEPRELSSARRTRSVRAWVPIALIFGLLGMAGLITAGWLLRHKPTQGVATDSSPSNPASKPGLASTSERGLAQADRQPRDPPQQR